MKGPIGFTPRRIVRQGRKAQGLRFARLCVFAPWRELFYFSPARISAKNENRGNEAKKSLKTKEVAKTNVQNEAKNVHKKRQTKLRKWRFGVIGVRRVEAGIAAESGRGRQNVALDLNP